MIEDMPVRGAMRELGITLEDAAGLSGVDMSYVGKQVRGDRPMSAVVRSVLSELFEGRAIACLPLTERLLRKHGEADAAEACERVGAELRDSGTPESRNPRST
jgi:hypothetical protein